MRGNDDVTKHVDIDIAASKNLLSERLWYGNVHLLKRTIEIYNVGFCYSTINAKLAGRRCEISDQL